MTCFRYELCKEVGLGAEVALWEDTRLCGLVVGQLNSSRACKYNQSQDVPE
jgi:hypothetical protein